MIVIELFNKCNIITKTTSYFTEVNATNISYTNVNVRNCIII